MTKLLRIQALRAALACLAGLASLSPGLAQAVKLKEIATVQGVRANQLTGYGLVVGLDGTGDQTTQAPFTTQSLQAMLQQMGVTLPAGSTMQLKNVAAVLVTAQLPAFAQPGQSLDVTVASLANAKSLKGGTLIATALKGADGQIYALAQGNVMVGGAGASSGGSKVQVNHLSAGRIPQGATVERSVPTSLQQGKGIQLDLAANDFGTARSVVRAINRAMGEGTAQALDGRTVAVRAPEQPTDRVGFLADLENLDIELAQAAAKIIINPRTGSVVMNQAVTIGPCAVAHGNLTVTVTSNPQVSQPNAMSNGQTVVTDRPDIQVKQDGGALMTVPAGTKLSDVVKALNALGANPADLMSILQAMKAAGAINAELEVI